MGISAFIQAGERVALSHYQLDAAQWRQMLSAPGPTLPLVSCWADRARVYVLLLDGSRPLMASAPIEDGRYLAPSSRFPAAEWGERVAYDLFGVEAMDARGDAPALDMGAWTQTWPLSARPSASMARTDTASEMFLHPECSGLRGPLGLTFAGVDQRGGAHGTALQAGYAHRGVLAAVTGCTPEEALRLVSRVTAGGYVAHPLAFVRAVEQARGVLPGPGVRDARFLLLEIERISIHLHDLAFTARGVGMGLFAALCDHAREAIAGACTACGVTRRLTDMMAFAGLREGYEPVPLAQAVCEAVEPFLADLTATQAVCGARLQGLGALAPALVRDYAIGGVVGRACGRSLDMRRSEAGMRLDALRVSGERAGDARARNAVRMFEIRDSLSLMRRVLATIGLDDDEPAPTALGEGIGACEGARGDVWYWVRLKNGLIDAIQARDPSASLMPVLGRVLDRTPVEHGATVLRSFGLSVSGVGL